MSTGARMLLPSTNGLAPSSMDLAGSAVDVGTDVGVVDAVVVGGTEVAGLGEVAVGEAGCRPVEHAPQTNMLVIRATITSI